ncbi:tyrosine-type recombinase/integrase, partial [Nocardioides sp.]|uniref:tyrosine-type recombinase/integrase n=1 Tax=Nocardioides sp. TaxID=35761 RepID=UPI0025DBDDAB
VSDLAADRRSVTVNRVMLELPIAQTGNGTPYLFKDYPKEGPRGTPKRISLGDDAQACIKHVIHTRGLGEDDLLLSMPNKAGLTGLIERATFGKQSNQVSSGNWTVLRTQAWPGGLPISRTFFRECVWRVGIERAGLPYRKFHALRASHISWLLAGGVDLPAVMERVGHTQFTTTRRYTKAMEDADRRALEGLESIKSRYGVTPRR